MPTKTKIHIYNTKICDPKPGSKTFAFRTTWTDIRSKSGQHGHTHACILHPNSKLKTYDCGSSARCTAVGCRLKLLGSDPFKFTLLRTVFKACWFSFVIFGSAIQYNTNRSEFWECECETYRAKIRDPRCVDRFGCSDLTTWLCGIQSTTCAQQFTIRRRRKQEKDSFLPSVAT
jgi:hypothetical protein